MSMDINKLLNGTLAGQMAKSLDKNDGEDNGKINKSIWNQFIKEIREETGDDSLGNEIKNFITVENAMNAIIRYAKKAVSQKEGDGSTIDEKAKVWAEAIENMTKASEEEPPEIDTDVSAEDEVPAEEEADPVIQFDKENFNNITAGQGLAGKFRYDSDEDIQKSLADATPEQLAYALRDYPNALKDLYEKGTLSQEQVLDAARKLGIEVKINNFDLKQKTLNTRNFWKKIESKAKEIRDSVDTKRADIAAEQSADAAAKEETRVINERARAGIELLSKAAEQNSAVEQQNYTGYKKTVNVPDYGKVDIYYNDDGSFHKAELFDKDGVKLMNIDDDKVQVPNNQGQYKEYENEDIDIYSILDYIKD